MAEITTKKGLKILVDDEDYDTLKGISWYVDTAGYARAGIKGKIHYMHRFLMNPPKGLVVDHINRNQLDNRRCNLRVVTQKENCNNRKNSRKTPKPEKIPGVDRRKLPMSEEHKKKISDSNMQSTIRRYMETYGQ